MEQKLTPLATIISMLSASASITTVYVQSYVSLTAGMVAIVSGCMAIRHYYYSTKKIRGDK